MPEITHDPRITILDHTADMGFAVHGKSLAEVFELSALALTTILTDPCNITPSAEIEVVIEGGDLYGLMYNWLSEILYQFDGEKKLFSGYRIEMTEDQESNYKLKAILSGEEFNDEKHEIRTYVKAITFHQMEILQQAQQCSARVFIDI